MQPALVRPRTSFLQIARPVELKGELVRKALHLLIALVPRLAAIDTEMAMLMLGAGTLFYVLSEQLRLEGHRVFIVSDLTIIASRDRDRGRFVLGPVTLGVGAMLSLLLYPSTAASIAIYALAFGDGLASLAGKAVRHPVIHLAPNKTLAGSLACFAAVLAGTWRLTGRPADAVVIAAAATTLELLPIRDFDNLILPVGTGFVAARLLQV